jgi:inorganic pyrophosphatase/exopolyphosphatase
LSTANTTEADHRAVQRLNEIAWIQDLQWFMRELQQ